LRKKEFGYPGTFSGISFFNTQGRVRKATALLHAPRAASRGRKSSLLDFEVFVVYFIKKM
jgi:hypothetical protein